MLSTFLVHPSTTAVQTPVTETHHIDIFVNTHSDPYNALTSIFLISTYCIFLLSIMMVMRVHTNVIKPQIIPIRQDVLTVNSCVSSGYLPIDHPSCHPDLLLSNMCVMNGLVDGAINICLTTI